MKKAFTLIEMMIAISILSIMILYLYKTNASINKSNLFYEKKVDELNQLTLKKRVMFLDISLMHEHTATIVNNDKNEDILFLQTTNSIHQRVNPYVTYIVKDKILYRLESLNKLQYPFSQTDRFDVDRLGKVKIFKVYKQKNKEIYLLHVKFKNADDILMKVNALNE